MDGAEPDAWSAVAVSWSEHWTGYAAPLVDTVLDLAEIGPARRVLDIGCGSGELLALAAARGAQVSGVDPAPGMLALAAERLPAADLRLGSFESLPFPDHAFDLVVAVNALAFAEDTVDALDEMARLAAPGGVLALANWAEAGHNDLDVIERALAAELGEEPPPDGAMRRPGTLGELLREVGAEVFAEEIVELPWRLADEAALVEAMLMGEDPLLAAERAPVVLRAAGRFRQAEGGYVLRNSYRFAVARLPG